MKVKTSLPNFLNLRRLPLWLVSTSIIFSVNYRFYISLRFGRSGAEPSYDDIVYLLDAQERLNILRSLGIPSAINSWINNPPHSPSSTLIASIPQFIFGNSSSAVYYFNSLVISLVVFFVFREIVGSKKISTFLTAVVIGSPLGPMLMFNFRPDPLYAVVLTMFAIRISKPDTKDSLASLILFPSVLLMIKPSFIAFTCIATFFFLGMNLRRYLNWKLELKAVVKYVIFSLFISGWYLINGLREIIYYVRSNTSGKTRSLWIEDGYIDALLTNLRAVVLQIGPAYSTLVTIFWLIVCIKSKEQLTKDKIAITLAGTGVINLAISVYTQISNPFFYLTTLIPWLYLSIYLLFSYTRTKGPVSQLTLQVTSILFLTSLLFLPSREWAAKEIRLEGPVNYELANFLRAERINHVYFFYAGGLNADTTKWYLGKDSNDIQFSNLGLDIFETNQAIFKVDSIKLEESALITRSKNINGFPSDKVQEDLNSYLLSESLSKKLESKVVGNYLVWSLRN